MIVLEFSIPEFLKGKKKPEGTKYFSFWKNKIKDKLTWAICLLFVKITYSPISLKEYGDMCENKEIEWTNKCQ